MRYFDKPAHVLHDMLVNREITSTELTKDVLARIDEVEGDVKAYLTITREEALKQAEAVDADSQEIQQKFDAVSGDTVLNFRFLCFFGICGTGRM